MFYITDDNLEKIKLEGNYSKLINELLDSYFKTKEPMTLEQKEQKLAELEAQMEYEAKIKEIKNGNYKH